MNRIPRRAAAALVAGTALAASAAALAGTAGPRPWAGVVHGDVTVIRADRTTDSFAFDRGGVSMWSESALSIARRDGRTVTVALDASTRILGTPSNGARAIAFSRSGKAFVVRVARGKADLPAPTAASLAAGGAAGAGGRRGRGPRAGVLRGVVHADVAALKADGSTETTAFDRGRVAAAGDGSVSIERPDGVTVTLAVDAATRIRGRIEAGGRAAALSRGGVAVRILARPAPGGKAAGARARGRGHAPPGSPAP